MDTKNSKMYIDSYGNKMWKDSNGLFHKREGPAVELTNGIKKWFYHGAKHRLDGPAFFNINNSSSGLYCIYGIYIEKIDFNSWVNRICILKRNNKLVPKIFLKET